MTNPYYDLPPQAFWRSAVAEAGPLALDGLYRPAFRLTRKSAVATAGSCFAQHISGALRRAGLDILDAEPAPNDEAPALAREYGYGIYSARYGNIYTTRQLRQLLSDSLAPDDAPVEVWSGDGRFYDAVRPAIEPGGFVSEAEVTALRRAHLRAVAQLFSQASHLIFTLGLTECWADVTTGRVYPLAPGIIAGEYDPARHRMLNLGYPDVIEDLTAIRDLLHRFNPAMRMILTVSPVPLTATASGQHVLAATVGSKAILRAAAGAFADQHADVDYFPAYEIVTNPAAGGAFYMPNLRDITRDGVEAVTATFLQAHGLRVKDSTPTQTDHDESAAEDVICEEILLDPHRR